MDVRTQKAKSNPILTREDWNKQRHLAEQDPGNFHGDIAKREIHWYDEQANAWMIWNDEHNQWMGLDADTGAPVTVTHSPAYEPWKTAFDDSDAPFYKWFSGGLTNACFNEVDRHVMNGHGDEIAFYFEGDRWDQAKNDGRGGPVVEFAVTRKQLMLETLKAAQVFKNLGLKKGDRIALNMPNIMEQIYYTEAAKRLGIVYTAVFGGFSDKTLSDRIHNAGAKVVITSDGGYRNAQIVEFKEAYTDPALDNYVPKEIAVQIVEEKLKELNLNEQQSTLIQEKVMQTIGSEITVERSDAMRGVGMALAQFHDMDAEQKSHIRTVIAKGLVDAPPRVEAVIVVRHTRQQDLNWRPERDRWSHELIGEAVEQILAIAREQGTNVANEQDLLALPTEDFIRIMYAVSKPEPVDAEYPLFIIYTSGSTGKPKGVVHVHGGYTAGLAHTMKVSFDATPGEDIMYVIADPGWITGQSYLISASLTTRTTSIVAEGAPVFPSAGRYASIIERYNVTIFKAGSTFLKTIMSNPQNKADVEQYSMDTLRVATFCAEPTSPAVQQFGMDLMTPQYINSYWATEHGGIVWTHFFGNNDFQLKADAHTFPLPWIFGDVWISESSEEGGKTKHRPAGFEEKGEIVITKPYPYLARYIWGDETNFGQPEWKGDADRYVDTYWGKWDGVWAYTQGDFAMKYEDESFSLHGRSDDVINVSGHRMGTEEIEGAILRDKQINPDSPVGNAIVIGAPHREKGLTPVAFIQTVPGAKLTLEDQRRLSELVRQEKGVVAVPSDYIEVLQFPETRSGKYMRRFLSNLLNGEELGDTSTLRNPESIDEIRPKIEQWRMKTKMEEEQKIFEIYRFFRVQYNDVLPGQRVATVTITNPPVNALNERALDELNTIVSHLERRDEIKVVIFTGQGTGSFVAGADVKQFLEEMFDVQDVLPLANKAHMAFSKIEKLGKPVIAAVNGVALGGGNEFQMATHYRIAEPHAEFGQPEINLNLIPGYGGTQRLPRLLQDRRGTDGFLKALEIILNGRKIDVEEAKQIGLIDEIIQESDDVLVRAAALAREYILRGTGALKEAFDRHNSLVQQWNTPQAFPQEAIDNSAEIQRILRQSKWAGREQAANRALEATRIGYEQGIKKGMEREAQLFAEAVIDPNGGKSGIQAFLDKKSMPLPTRPRFQPTEEKQDELIEQGELLPIGAPYFPGFTPIPEWQYAYAVVKNDETGAVDHGDPIDAEKKIVIPVEKPTANEVLLYVLASEVNFNDIWALTGIPVSTLDDHDLDYHVTGSGGIALVASVGPEVKREGRVKVGDLVTIYSGQNNLLSPTVGLDPMFADFSIQGYQGPDGSHQQFMIAQAPQVHVKPQDATLEAAGSYILNLGTIYRALFTTLSIEPNKTMFVEGAATGTGLEALKSAARNGLAVTGMVSSEERAAYIQEQGAAGVINRRNPEYGNAFTKVPADPSQWAAWEAAGQKILDDYRAQNNGRLADYVVSHAGEVAFPRSFQMMEKNGVLTFYGASSGYHFTFMGKEGASTPRDMYEKALLRAGESVLIYYGTDTKEDGIVDQTGLVAIEAARDMGARIVVATYTDAQKEFVQSLGYGDAVRGVLSIEEIKRREGENFVWPDTMPDFPNPKTETEAFKEAVRYFTDYIFKPFGGAVAKYLRSPDNPRGYPDLIFDRAGHDALGVSTTLLKPYTGRVVFSEDMNARRYSFYAPQVWMRQRRVYMPTANIWGTHLSNAYEVIRMNEMIDAGMLEITEPVFVEFDQLPEAHQEMWENRHVGSSYVVNHAIPQTGLKTKDQLYEAWSAQMNEKTSE
ncbi:3-hydroxypropionyl-CoA synthetase /3-hydroxypropionyl-CoA dehydratase /acrylyl-CoA reductase (NADPH) [Aneurinibacillus soli]|uniref:acetate--CoA ligase n=1 Tax=Aneurinibacillus soli TaxID=1500254 RepID=A0A0U5BH72_9BACL|nr:AMP-binding protein [Aneurinibacillus soli]PYE58617.1 3-hydroxypropionyl-CoA synthetase /3-hydroxypropionyl-CoA dehydratase /acrylyl-CoA reductase (NADPH) [Aneurinibacillus soli]BAU29623.1 Acetyl-coenzyme A synthetase [Aneurinibacillus soli]